VFCFVLRATIRAAPRPSRREEGEQIMDADAADSRDYLLRGQADLLPYRTISSAACSSSWASISPKFLDWLPLADCGEGAVPMWNFRAACGGNFSHSDWDLSH
jgi:hypothetical protein